MKLIKKEDCKFEGGYLVKGKSIVADPQLIEEVNRFAEMLNIKRFIENAGIGKKLKDKAAPMPKYEKLPRANQLVIDEPETPVIDARIEEALKFVEETKAINAVEDANETLKQFPALAQFVYDEMFVYDENAGGGIPCKMLVNPLSIEAQDVVEIVGWLALHKDEVAAVM